MRVFFIVLVLSARVAYADDGYCDYVEGVASATSAVMLSPEVFGEFGYIEQSPAATNPDVQDNSLRLIAGVKYRLTGIAEGFATRDRAHADCRRHQALEKVRGETAYLALAARAKVLDDALAEATKLGDTALADQEARRTTAQEATATRLRVEELRGLAAETHRQLAAVPAPSDGSLSGALVAFQSAGDAVEHQEGRLRRLQAFDVSVRAGVDAFLDRSDNPSPYFAVLSVGVNIGTLFQGSGNSRAASGRSRMIRSGHDPLAVDATASRIHALIVAETTRESETAALESDLTHQLEALSKVGGEDGKRYRQTVWFDWVKVRAEHAYLTAHLAALRQVLGDAP